MIITKNLNLWAIEPQDLPRIYLWVNDPEIIKLCGMTPIPRSGWDLQRWLDISRQNQNELHLAIKMNDNTHIGNISLFNVDRHTNSAEVGIYIGDGKYRGKGYAKEALIAFTRFCFEEFGLHRIYARIAVYNKASINFFQKCKFVKEGTQRESFYTWGKYWDVDLFSMLSNEFKEKFPYRFDEEVNEGKN
jgi:RimJ/RimL family protein N-acetyltransferase